MEDISPLKIVTAVMRDSEKFRQIVASIREVGIIEAPVVAAPRRGQGKYMLLDGHLRIEALREIEVQEVTCLVSTDDESFTYNKHISRLSPIQEHRMILQAIKRGVSEEKLARALNLNVTNIISKRDLLNGICPEAAELLKDKMVSAGTAGEAARGADQVWWWGWRRTRSEPTRSAEFSLAKCTLNFSVQATYIPAS